jgi:asparagine synthetase B (glutamine-hydrolysing)
MCGILGYRKFGGNERFTPEQITDVFAVMEERGSQATGFWSPITGIVKKDETAKVFVNTHQKELLRAIGSDLFIGHTRAATSGRVGYATPSDNNNNHPHESEHFVLIHNGHFGTTPEIKGFPYKGICDSEIPLSYLETFGIERGLELLCKVDGFALAFVDKTTGHLYLIRHSNPIVIALDERRDALVFSSTGEGVYNFCDVEEKRGIIRKSTGNAYTIPEDTLYRCDDKGLVELAKISFVNWVDDYKKLPDEVKDKMVFKEPKTYVNNYRGRDPWDECEGSSPRFIGNKQKAQITLPIIRLSNYPTPNVQYSFLRTDVN